MSGKVFTLLSLLFTLVTPCEAAIWIKLNENAVSRLMLDRQSISEQNQLKKTWVKIEYKRAQKNLEFVDEKEYNNTKALWYFDCDAKKSATTQVFQYANQTLIYSAGVDVKSAEFIEPLPESDVEIAMQYVCKSIKPATSNSTAPAPTTTAEKPPALAAEQPKVAAKEAPKESSQEAPAKTVEKTEPAPPSKAEAHAPPALAKKTPPKGSGHTEHWSYEGKQGPENWGKLSPEYAACDTGSNQSPIDIKSTIHAALKPIRTIQKFPAKEMINNGHTIQINFNTGNMMVLDKSAFQLKQVHFHTPSENMVDGRAYPLEAHFVHADDKGNLAVLAVMFKEGEANQTLEKLWPLMPKEINQAIPLKVRFTPNDLMPIRQQYYRFGGSLTTPPCSEGVRWVLMKAPLTASKEQIKAFEAIIHHHNSRPVQPLNGRIVLE
ncbi:MAG: carbonic anhydrase family protein [Methylophilus sp.]|nr:carbonic anhydrase family protein [Methylophilus sp.]